MRQGTDYYDDGNAQDRSTRSRRVFASLWVLFYWIRGDWVRKESMQVMEVCRTAKAVPTEEMLTVDTF